MLFFVILTAILLSIDFYVLMKWKKFVKLRQWNKYFYIVPWILFVSFILLSIILAYRRLINPVADSTIYILNVLVGLWYLPKIPIFIVNLFKDIITLFFKFFSFIFRKKAPSIVANTSRREFVRNASWSLASVPFLVYANGAMRTIRDTEIIRRDIPIWNLGKGFENFKIVQISDIHAGSFKNVNAFRETRWLISSLKPDMIALTGDFVNNDPRELDLILEDLSMFDARYGVFACLGNHDHYMTNEQHLELLSKLHTTGMKLLIDNNTFIDIMGDKLYIAGVDSISFGRRLGDFNKTMDGIPKSAPTILLAHDPTSWEEDIIEKTSADLTLSGHTHGGQFGFDFFGNEVSPASWVYNQWAGLYQHKDQFIYVNRGLGTVGPPVRVGINPEITVITLKSYETAV